MSVIRRGRHVERRFGRYWREVCECGWIGRQWTSHRAAQTSLEGHRRRVRYGWYGDLKATTPPERLPV